MNAAELEAVVERAVERAMGERDRRVFSPEQAADWLGVSASTVRRMMADGRLTFVSIGAKRKIARSVLERFVDPELAAVAS